jgi:glycine/D-amino acid oxidase-like deaminating enzyme
MNDTTYDKIIIGAGPAGRQAGVALLRADEKARTADPARKYLKVLMLTDKIHAPTAAGTNLVLGIDGFEEGELPPHAAELNEQVRAGLNRIREIVVNGKSDCRLDMYYQILGHTRDETADGAKFLVDRFHYRPEEWREVARPEDRVRFEGVGAAIETTAVGQINGPEYLETLDEGIRRMGGEIVEGARYTGYERKGGVILVHTTRGTFRQIAHEPWQKPLLAGGVRLMREVLPGVIKTLWTTVLHVQLSPEDARSIALRPVAFYDPNSDYLWGSLDRRNVLTLGQGFTFDPSDEALHKRRLRETFEARLPHLKGKYDDKIEIIFKERDYTDNQLPVVGSLPDFDVMTGFGGRGFAQSMAAAEAYADFVVNGNDRAWRMWQSLNVDALRPTSRPVRFLRSLLRRALPKRYQQG